MTKTNSSQSLGDFTQETVRVEGAWEDYFGTRRFRGQILAPVEIRLISLCRSDIPLKRAGQWAYAKSGKFYQPDFAVDLFLQPTYEGKRFQLVLRCGNAINSEAQLEKSAARSFSLYETFEFTTGFLTSWAWQAPGKPAIKLLAFAYSDLKKLRNGIWSVKPRFQESLPENWKLPLSKTRKGWIAL
jgi:hypothetical protein